MSITVSTCDQIHNSPTNNSKTKQLYTFTKSSRFSKRRLIMCDKFYDASAVNTSRAAGFGYGDKYDFTKDVPRSPPANTYNIRSEFNSSEKQKRGFGFGCGRSEMQVTGPFALTFRDKNPGPGTYQPACKTDQIVTYTLGRKYNDDDHEKSKVPGPGSYPVPFTINQKGNYFLSKYKNSCIRSFKGSIERGGSPQNKVPGPGSYATKITDLSSDGRYFLSKTASNPVRSFGNSARANIAQKTDTPGPGNYKLPSQFGHYKSKFAIKKPKTEQNSRKVSQSQKQNNNA